mmetsp:Transcript_32588/g.24078  ORF Transcript_32588/g.24078 Transcript_32588/m.24078 type:complete len:108 (-) Transcript_32588:32-355(-)
MMELHHSKDQWRDPDEFIPERFDPNSEYYLTPLGGKRHPMSFLPFEGGPRVCLGKTFAEFIGKLIAVHLFNCFDFEIEENKYEGQRVGFHVNLWEPYEIFLKLKPLA